MFGKNWQQKKMKNEAFKNGKKQDKKTKTKMRKLISFHYQTKNNIP